MTSPLHLPAAGDAFYANPVLFGFDPHPGIVAVEPAGAGRVALWRRVHGALQREEDDFHPFLWITDPSLLEGGPAPLEVRALQGSEPLRILAVYADLDALAAARRHLKGVPASDWRALTDAVHQYLLRSGRTFFKGMAFDDLVRMQIDIETYTAPGFEFSNAARAEDCIIAIGVATNRGFERVLWGRDMTETAMLEALGALIQEHDPDVIEGHNVFRFDLEYIRTRAARHRVRLGWGRGGGTPAVRPSRLQVAERTIDYTRWDVPGRHVVDTWLLAQYYDVSHRSLPSYGLKDVARHFGFAAGDRTYVAGDRIAWTYDHDPERLRAYCLDDVRETRALSDLLAPIYFLQAQMFPYAFQNVMLRGNATRIDALFVREYLRRGHALPSPATTATAYEGGYADMFESGVLGPVLHVDVQSLYPSLMLTYGLKPRGDALNVFLGLLKDLREFRLSAKALAKSGPDEQRAWYDALQSTFKILINSFYGYLGTTFCHFADNEAAGEVTRRGRELINLMIDWLRANGCRPVEVDTDGIYFLPGDGEEAILVEGLARALPEGIVVELSGRYPAMFSYKVKNYALLDERGAVIIKGSGLKSRGIERYLRRFMEDLIGLLLQGRAQEVDALVDRRLDDIACHRLDIRELSKTETLTESVESYREKVAARKRNASAVYELAAASGRSYRAGDSFSYYVAGKGKKVKVYEASRPTSAWDAQAPDENVEYYQQKLRDLVKKFSEFLPRERELWAEESTSSP